MSSCQRAKPFTGLVNGFHPVVGLAPDPAAFSSSRLSGSPGLTKNQRGRALDGASQASSRSWRERALGTLGADNGGERVPTPPLPHGREMSALPPHSNEGALDHFSSRQPTHRTPFIPIASKQPPNPRIRMHPGRAKRAQDAFFPLTGTLFHFKRENGSQTPFCAFPQRTGFHGIFPIPTHTPSPFFFCGRIGE